MIIVAEDDVKICKRISEKAKLMKIKIKLRACPQRGFSMSLKDNLLKWNFSQFNNNSALITIEDWSK